MRVYRILMRQHCFLERCPQMWELRNFYCQLKNFEGESEQTRSRGGVETTSAMWRRHPTLKTAVRFRSRETLRLHLLSHRAKERVALSFSLDDSGNHDFCFRTNTDNNAKKLCFCF